MPRPINSTDAKQVIKAHRALLKDLAAADGASNIIKEEIDRINAKRGRTPSPSDE